MDTLLKQFVAQVLTRFSIHWNNLRTNPTFVAFRGLFIGALFGQLQAAYEAGHLALNLTGLSHMVVGAFIAAGLSVWHLYLPQPTASTKDQNAK